MIRISSSVFIYCVFVFTSWAQSVNITNINCLLSERHYSLIQTALIEQLSFYGSRFPLGEDISVSCYLLGDRLSYEKFAPKISHGSYYRQPRHIYIYKNSRFFAIFKHELSHWLVAEGLSDLPVWLNEGLAGCLEESTFNKGEMVFHVNPAKWKLIVDGLSNTSLKTWLKHDQEKFYSPEQASFNYAMAWGTVYFLYQKDKDLFTKILLHLGVKNGETHAVLNRYYPGKFKQFEADLYEYFHQKNILDHFNKGIKLFNEEKYGEALSCFQKTYENLPSFPTNLLYLAFCYNNLAHEDSAQHYFERVAEVDPTLEGSIFLNLAHEAYQRLDYEGSVMNFSRFLQYGSVEEQVSAFLWMGLSYHHSFQYEKAIRSYWHAHRLNPNNSDALNNLSLVYHLTDKYDSAIICANRAIELKPSLANAYAHRGFAFLQKGELEKCQKDLETAIRLRPEYPATYYYRGILEEKTGNIGSAMDDWKLALGLAKDPFLVYCASKKLRDAGLDHDELQHIYTHRKIQSLRSTGLGESELRARTESLNREYISRFETIDAYFRKKTTVVDSY